MTEFSKSRKRFFVPKSDPRGVSNFFRISGRKFQKIFKNPKLKILVQFLR
nr:MAG TPA: hypothetical protein [Caudoviricetes sp.]